MRNVANLVPVYQPDSGTHGVSAALEYAVSVLKVKHIVVLRSRPVRRHLRLHRQDPAAVAGDFISRWIQVTTIKPGEVVRQRDHESILDFTIRIEKAAVLVVWKT